MKHTPTPKPEPSIPPSSAMVVYYPQTEGHLTPDQLREVFARVGRHDPLWQALMQLLQQRLANATVAAAQRDDNAPGRIEELIDLQRELATWRDQAPSKQTRPRG